MIRLIVTDDHPVVREGIQTVLADQNEIKLQAFVNSGEDLLDLLNEVEADVILMDINMPGMNGIEATRQVKKNYPGIKVLCFSQYDEKRFVRQILKRGANGYLLKNASANELIEAVKTVHNGDIYLSEDLPNIFDDPPKRKSRYMFPELTNREKDVLNKICEELNNHQIAKSLLLSHNTVETHRANLLLKVGAKNTAGLVKWAVENNIV